MPELPEVETVRLGLARVMTGNRIAAVKLRRSDLRFPLPEDFSARLAGQEVQSLTRRAKYLVASLSSGESLIMHLGMSGRFTVLHADGRMKSLGDAEMQAQDESPGAGLHDHVMFQLEDGTRIIYSDPRRFGMMDIHPTHDLAGHWLTQRLGIEPLSRDLNAKYLVQALRGRKAPLKSVLVDQRLIAGIGNIYACEVLFRARLSPRRTAGSLENLHLQKLVSAIRGVLKEAIKAGGSTLRDYAGADGSPGAFQHRFSVYDREGQPCRRRGCTGKIRRIVQSGRSTFYCPKCQH
jgi:formamidopyrimidine-DNA glycosylase